MDIFVHILFFVYIFCHPVQKQNSLVFHGNQTKGIEKSNLIFFSHNKIY